MTLASDISTTSTSLSDIKNAIIAKGVTPTGNITTYATAIDNINTDGIGPKREVKNGVYQMPTEDFTFSLPSGVTEVGNYALAYSYYGDSHLIGADLSSVTTVRDYGLYYTCAYTAITNINVSSLTTVSGMGGCNSLCRGCQHLITVDFKSLTILTNGALAGAFGSCTELTDIYFRALKTTSFGSFLNQFNGLMTGTGTTTTHTIHFPSNLESTIQGLQGYPLFGGSSGYVVLTFDLPATS